MADFDSAIRLNPRYALAYFSRGALWQRQGDPDRARADFNAAIRVSAKQAAPSDAKASAPTPPDSSTSHDGGQ